MITEREAERAGRVTLGRVLAVVTALFVVTSAGVAGVALPVAGVQTQQTSDVLYRVNAAGPTVSAIDGGPDWVADSSTGHLVAGGTETASHGQPDQIHSSVPASTPDGIWNDERWDPDSGAEMQYEFDVASGTTVEVRLYFYDGYSGTSSAGDRVFDVSVEDQTVEDFDVIETFGDQTGAMQSFTVTSDGTIDVDFAHVTENPQINAIEIVATQAHPDELGAPDTVDFGTVVVGNAATESVTLTNLGNASNASHPDIDVTGVSITGTDAGEFSHDFSGSTTLAPGESTTVNVTFAPSDAQAKAATLEVTHTGTNSPVTVDLTGEGASDVPVGFQKGTLQGFSTGQVTALDFGPDGRLYASTQGGTVYALNVTRTGEAAYTVDYQKQIDAIKQIPNHDDHGNHNPGETNRQITGLTVGGTASQPVVYVSSSDPTIDVGTDDDDTDTNSGAISRLTLSWGGDGQLADSEIDHDVLVLGLPRSEENHATNGIDLSPDGDTLYVAQGGHTNKGAPGDNFGHTPEYALSGATLDIDLATIRSMSPTSLQSHDPDYPDLDYYYAIPTVQGGPLPFGGDDGLNQAKLVDGGPVGIWSPGYRNPYDLAVTEAGLVYVTDNGPNGGWGGEPADASGNTVESAADVTNHPNEDDSYTTSDQVHLATEGHYAGHAAPIRANPDQAGLYFENGTLRHDFDAADTPVPFSLADPRQADYVPPASEAQGPDTDDPHDGSLDAGFSPLGGIVEYRASNFGGEMQGDLLVVEFFGSTSRLELNATGEAITNRDDNFLTASSQMLGITAQDDDEVFPGTVWTSWNGIAVFEPNDFGQGGGAECTGADDASLDEDGDGYDNADELDAGTDPCSSASTPHDFDGDGTSDLNDDDDDNDGATDEVDPFAVDADNGTTTGVPLDLQFQPNSHPNTILDLGFTGLMTNGVDDYQDLYDPTQLTAGGAANVLTVENVPQGDAHQSTNTQQFAFQTGVDAPSEPFVVHTTVSGFPETPEDFQSMGLFLGNGDQDNYLKLVVAANGGTGGIEYAIEQGGSFSHPAGPNVDAPAVTGPGNSTDLTLTVFPGNDTVHAYYTPEGGTQQFFGAATIPASWLDSSDGSALAVGVISTSNGASSTFDATWTHLTVETVAGPALDADAGADQTVDEGTTVTLDATGSTGENLSFSWNQVDTGGPLVTLQDADTATPTFTAPDVDADQTLTFEVEVTDGTSTDEDTVNVTVQDTDVAAGEVLFRVNAGGPELAAIDGGPNWSADQPNAHLVGGDTQTVDWSSSSIGDAALNGGVDPSVPSSTPTEVFTYERFDPESDGEMQWEFPVDAGTDVEVRLYFADQFQGTPDPDERLFDVSIDGTVVLDDYNISAAFGDDAGGMESVVVTSDGTVDVDFAHVSENPLINAIEIVVVGAENQPPNAAFGHTPTEPNATEQVTFDASASEDPDGSIASFEWDFDGDDATDATGEEVHHTFSSSGTHAVTLTVTDDDGATDSITQNVTVTEAPTEQLSVPEAVASANESGNDSVIDLQEIQLAINWWATGQAVPGTGGEQLNQTQIQQLINLWATNAIVDGGDEDQQPTASFTVSPQQPEVGQQVTFDGSGSSDPDGGGLTYSWLVDGVHNHAWHEATITHTFQSAGDHEVQLTVEDADGDVDSVTKTVTVTEAATASALVEVTPDSGVEATTYGSGTYQVTNTGETNITSVSFDLSTASLPDVVFDPNGTAGDPTGQSFTLVSDGGTGVTTPQGGVDAFSQPHNGVNGDDGYDVMTVEFADFQPGEMATFWADNDPTSIKGATVGSQEAGPISGLELARSTITVTYEDGTTQTTHLFGDGSAGGSTAVVNASEASAPSIDVVGVPLNGSVLDARHSAATVASAGQTVTITGQPGETVTLLRVEAELSLDDVPQPYHEIEAYEANDAEQVSYHTVTLNASGEAAVPITLTNSTPDSGYNYLAATHGEPTGDMGLVSNVVVLKHESGAGDGGDGGTGDVAFAVNAGGGQYTAADGTVYEADTLFSGGSTYSVGLAIGNTTDDTLYQSERYGDFSYDVPVPDGTYEVTLKFAEIFQGVASTDSPDSSGPTDGTNENDRVFNVSIEGQEVLTNYDIFAEVGPLNATDEAFTVDVTDGTLNVVFETKYDNAKVSAIKVENASGDGGGDANQAPSVDPIADQTVTEGDTAQVSVSASDPDGDALTLSASGPGFVTLTDNGDGTGTVDIAPQSGDAGTYTVDVTADDGSATATESFQVAVEEPATTTGVAYRVNAGESTDVPATDGGPDWTGVAGTSSPLLVSVGGPNGDGNFCGGDDISPTSSVPSSTPAAVYDCERYGEMHWAFPTADGQSVEVRLYLGNQFSGTSEPGDRQFNVSIEGTQVLTQYDPVADVGHANGTMKNFTVTSDGTVDVVFEVGAIENPQVNAIEILNVSDGGGDTASGSAEVAVTSGSGIDASTFTSGSYEITNTGQKDIASVSFDLSTAAFPDVVFDPAGTAGDAGAKCFEADSGASAVGLLTDGDGSGADSCEAPFSQPHNGVNGSDGYDALTVEFGDFGNGETFAFSVDNDPTSIQDATGTGAAGSISGLELAGATVTVEYADGSTQTTNLASDGSDGGSQATAKDAVPAAPSIDGVQGVTLDGSVLDAHHSGATVTDAGQTVELSGPPGATVELLRVEGQLQLDQATGYEIESLEANDAVAVATQTVTLDSSGQATAAVTLTNSTSQGGYNYLVATVVDGAGDTGQTSNVVVLKLE